MEKMLKAIILIIVTACSDFSGQDIKPNIFYKRDMVIVYENQAYEGVAVLPEKAKYNFHFIAKGDLDLFTFTTCHREYSAENAWNVTENRGLIFKRTIDKKREIKLEYAPNDIEKNGACPIMLGGYEEQKGRHSWGFVDFQDQSAKLKGTVECNGALFEYPGVSICQSRAGLIQSIKFPEPVKLSPDPECDFGIKEGQSFDIEIKPGQCVYAFMGQSGLIHRLTTFGYEQIPIRK